MLHMIAMLTMLIDHVGLLFYPEQELFRIVGRIAFPLYSWFLVQGFRHSSNLRKYMARLFWLACISQIPFSLAFQTWELNVVFTLLLSLIALYAAERAGTNSKQALLLAGVVVLTLVIPMDYGIYGLLLAFLYRYLAGWKLLSGHLLLNGLFTAVLGASFWIQLYSIMGTLLIAFPVPSRLPMHYKWLYRSFYPAHLAVLFILYSWIYD